MSARLRFFVFRNGYCSDSCHTLSNLVENLTFQCSAPIPFVHWSALLAQFCTIKIFVSVSPQIVFDEKELRREISHAIKNVHGVRQVMRKSYSPFSRSLWWFYSYCISVTVCNQARMNFKLSRIIFEVLKMSPLYLLTASLPVARRGIPFLFCVTFAFCLYLLCRALISRSSCSLCFNCLPWELPLICCISFFFLPH